jgi:hypothetical protein
LINDQGDRRFHITDADLSEAANALLVASRKITNGLGIEAGFEFTPAWAVAEIFGALAAKVNDAGWNAPDSELVVGNPPLRECGCRGFYGCFGGRVPGFVLNIETRRHQRVAEVVA